MRKAFLLFSAILSCAIAVAQEPSINFLGDEPEPVQMDFIGQKDDPVTSESRRIERSDKKDILIDWFAHEGKGSAPPQGSSGDNKLATRRANRVLVIYHATNYNEKVCDQNGNWCRQEFRNAAPSIAVISSMKKLSKTWNSSGGEESHFVLLNYDKPEDRKVIQALGVKLSQMPIAVRESDPSIQKSLSGFDADKIGKLWNEWLDETKQYQPPETKHGMPSLGGKGLTHWHIKNGTGTVAEMRAHLCDPNSEHKLPKKVVDAMSDEEIWRYHDWDHAVMEGSISPSATRQSKSTAPSKASEPRASASPKRINVSASLGYAQGTLHQKVTDRIHSIVASEIRPMPSMASQAGNDKKKLRDSKRSGSMTRERGFGIA